MGSFSLMHWGIVALAAVLLFGSGRVARTMGEVGQGLRAFRKGLSEDESATRPSLPPRSDV